MKPTQRVDNDIYRRLGREWWDDDVDDADRVIGEIARVLKPGGLFFHVEV
jgi:SAM-dependent methyltransferase